MTLNGDTQPQETSYLGPISVNNVIQSHVLVGKMCSLWLLFVKALCQQHYVCYQALSAHITRAISYKLSQQSVCCRLGN